VPIIRRLLLADFGNGFGRLDRRRHWTWL
jgi:hypothetical protein